MLPPPAPGAPYSLEIVDDVCRVAPPKLGHGDIDLLIVLFNVDLDILVQLQLPFEGRVQRVFVQDTAVEHALTGQLWGTTQSRQGYNSTPNSYSKHGRSVPLLGETLIRYLKIFKDQAFYQKTFLVNLVQITLVK